MGMAASQSRFLALTSRKHDIGVSLERLSLEKMSLTREMRKISKNYNNAINSKVMKWSTNGGASYSDLSYKTLMHPNSANGYKPILLTNCSDKVVVDSKYKKYAEMISANGLAGGTWNGADGEPRASILASLTGIDASKINDYEEMKTTVENADETRYKAIRKLGDWQKAEKDYAPWSTAADFADKLEKFNEQDLRKLYNGGKVHISSEEELESLFKHIKTSLSKYFADSEVLGTKDKTAFEKACDDVKCIYKQYITSEKENAEDSRKIADITGSNGDWNMNFKILMDSIINTYANNEGGTHSTNSNKETIIKMRDTTSGSKWDEWYKTYISLNEDYEAKEDEYAATCESRNIVFDSNQETLLAYYDRIFEAIAEKGWVEDGQVEDNEYLNQMLQNNQYFITTMTENTEYDEDLGFDTDNYKYNYDTNIASNFDNIVMVNDQKARDDALSDYEYEKSIISEKEARVDARMKNLETEQSSIIKMMESIEKVAKDNVETYFSIFS